MTIDMLARASTAVTGLVGATYATPTVASGDEFRTATNTPPISVGIMTQNPAATSFMEGLLSPDNMIDVLKLADTPAAQNDVRDKPLWDRATLLDAIKESKSFAAGDASAAKSLADRYTSQDIALIRATTGYNVVSKGALTTIVDDDGNPPSADISEQVWQLAGSIELSRFGGKMDGELTTKSLEEMFDSYARLNVGFRKEWLDKARAYLDGVKDTNLAKV